jgi:hypothetical protein
MFHALELGMKPRFIFALILVLFLSACGSTTPGSATTGCPAATGTPPRLEIPPDALPTATPGPAPTPVLIKIGGKDIQINKVVEGPLCNDSWSGTVYVTCNVQVYPWEQYPTFLQNCNLDIEPGTVVYVANHNNTAYYNGCSCHTGQIAAQ